MERTELERQVDELFERTDAEIHKIMAKIALVACGTIQVGLTSTRD